MTVKKLLTPADFREYQPIITSHQLDVPRGAVFATMGLGKSIATLTTIDALIMAGEDAPTLILGPKRVASTVWGEEAAKWSHTKHLRVVPIMGNEKQRIKATKYEAEIYTMGYESIPWAVEHYGSSWPFKTVVADELSRVKSFRLRQGGQRAAALGRVIHTHVKRFYGLTGSPCPNGLKDIWGPLWMCDKGSRLGRTFDAFSTRWFKASPDGYGTVALPHAEEEIKELIKDICLSVDPKDYFDLKEPVIIDVEIDLPPKVRELYNEMEKNYYMQLDCGSEITAFNGAAKSMKMLQICSGACYLDQDADSDSHPRAREWKLLHDEKLDALDDIVEEAGGSPIIVTFQFKSDLARLLKKYPDGRQLAIDSELIEFKTGKWRLAFAHPASAGHGIDQLQNHCFTMVNYSQSWNLEQMEQIVGRIGPIRQFQAGFSRNVFIYNLIARDTIDGVVAERIRTKSSIQDSLFAAMKRRKEGT